MVPTARAATRTWDGGGTNDTWTTAANWVGDITPVAGDDVVFPLGAARLSNRNDFPAGTPFNSITFAGGSYSLTGSNIVLNAGVSATNTSLEIYFNLPITLGANQSITTGNPGVNFYLAGNISLGDKTLTFAGDGAAQVASVISGAGGLTKAGAGSVLLYGNSTFDGPVQILQGGLRVYGGNALGSFNGNTTIPTGTLLALLNPISVSEPLVLAGSLSAATGAKTLSGPITLTDPNATIQVNAGAPLTINGVLSGSGGFSKTASGVLTLNGNNTYAGSTTISAGTLQVNGFQPATPIALNSGTLAGTGTVGAITSGFLANTLAPGGSSGILTCSNVALTSSTTFAIELNGPAPGSGYGQLSVSGSVNLNNATLSVSNNLSLQSGQSFRIIDNDGSDAVTGTFGGLPEGEIVPGIAGTNQLQISYVGGTGNDVVLAVAQVPLIPDGVVLWTNRYNGPSNNDDGPLALAVDSSGNALVAGYSYDNTSGYDYATVKYSGAGVALWTNRYDGPGQGDGSALALAVDGDGNVLVTGASTGTNGTYDFATIKYSSAGVALWTNRYEGPGHGDDRAIGVAVDSSGNVYVSGPSSNGTNDDFATIKYSSGGVPLWTNGYAGPGNGTDSAAAMALDQNGNVFVTGPSRGSGSFDDYATVAYSGAGAPLWTNRYNGPANGNDSAAALAVDSSGNVFVTGTSPSSSGLDYGTVKYSNAGLPLWTNRYNGPGNGSDEAYAIGADSSGNIFVTGQSWSGVSWDYATIKYSNTGAALWTNRYNGPSRGNDYAYALAVDSTGNVFVTGYSDSGGFNDDYATVAYSPSGEPLWYGRYDGPAHNYDEATAVAVDGAGNVFVTGYSFGGGSDYDYATIKYASSVPAPGYLGFQVLGPQLVLSWTNTGFALQSAPAVTGTYTNVPGATNPYTNSLTGAPQFFRLKGN